MNTLRFIALGAMFLNLANVQAFPVKKTLIGLGGTAAVATSVYAANRFGYLPMPSVSMETVKNAAFAVKSFGGSVATKGLELVKSYPKTAATVAAVGTVGTVGAVAYKKYFGKPAQPAPVVVPAQSKVTEIAFNGDVSTAGRALKALQANENNPAMCKAIIAKLSSEVRNAPAVQQFIKAKNIA
jgi:hypothetical protein